MQSAIAVGIVLAISGNVVISVGLNVQKYAHNKNDKSATPVPYAHMKLWWLGNFFMIGGEIGNFLAFGFAQASLVAPLGAMSVISNAIIATFLLHEPFRIRDLVGISLAILGDVLIILNSAQVDIQLTNTALMSYLAAPLFIAYILLLSAAVVGAYFCARKFSQKTPVWDLLICSLLGSVTTMSCKAISTAIRLSVAGINQFNHGLPYVLTLVTAGTGFLNKAMRQHGNNQVVPTYFVLFAGFSILGGIVLYREFELLVPLQIVGFVMGCMMTFLGVYLLTSKRPKSADPGRASPVPSDLSQDLDVHTDDESMGSPRPTPSPMEPHSFGSVGALSGGAAGSAYLDDREGSISGGRAPPHTPPPSHTIIDSTPIRNRERDGSLWDEFESRVHHAGHFALHTLSVIDHAMDKPLSEWQESDEGDLGVPQDQHFVLPLHAAGGLADEVIKKVGDKVGHMFDHNAAERIEDDTNV